MLQFHSYMQQIGLHSLLSIDAMVFNSDDVGATN